MATAAASLAQGDLIHAERLTGHTGVRITGVAVTDMSEAEGMTPQEGSNLISFLYEHSQNIYTMYRHRWQPGDLVMWDNRCTLHAGVYDHGEQPRTLYRVMCEGERPFCRGDPCGRPRP